MNNNIKKSCLLFSASIAMFAFSSLASAAIFSASGPSPVSIQTTVDQFRLDLGALNPNVAGSFGSGRREINWDGVPDAFAAPNNLPANFFNANSPRGVVFSTPGTGFQVSATSASGGPIDFGNIDASYTSIFAPFSAQRLFTALGSNITDVTFFIPGSSTPALTTGFGSVFSDVDSANVSSLQFFDVTNASLGTFFVPNTAGNETVSFLGVSFPTASVSRVRITSGNQVLAAGNTALDTVVMDDFIYGEPRAASAGVPDAGPSALLLGLGLGGLIFARWSKRHTVQKIS